MIDELIEQWETFSDNSPQEIRDLYGSAPRFEDDEIFLPLQAADFWAWWVRRGYEEGALSEYQAGHFGTWNAIRPIPDLAIIFSEDDLVASLIQKIERTMGFGAHIYDANVRAPKNALPPMSASRSKMRAMIRRWLKGKQP